MSQHNTTRNRMMSHKCNVICVYRTDYPPRVYPDIMANNNNLAPYNTSEEGRARASAAGKKSVEVRRANKLTRELVATTDATQLATQLAAITTTFKRDELPAAAAATAQYLISKVLTGGIEVHGKDVAALIATLVDVARLEEGQSTSNAVIAHVSSSATLDRLHELRGVTDVGGVNVETTVIGGVNDSE
jgi:hypothetical protein